MEIKIRQIQNGFILTKETGEESFYQCTAVLLQAVEGCLCPNPDAKRNAEISGHEFVELGLPSGLKWATCNVGAESSEDYGDCFAWGETKPKSSYNKDNNITYGFSTSTLKSRGIIGADGNLTAVYDVASANWGRAWRMPTLNEMKELLNECTWECTTRKGINGYLVTGPNGNSIFLPAAGYKHGADLCYGGDEGSYWSATPYDDDYNACILCFDSNYHGLNSCYYRHDGRAVRPVSDVF